MMLQIVRVLPVLLVLVISACGSVYFHRNKLEYTATLKKASPISTSSSLHSVTAERATTRDDDATPGRAPHIRERPNVQ